MNGKHEDPFESNFTEDDNLCICPWCKRWLTRKFIGASKAGRKHHLYFQVNYDKQGGFYYFTDRLHSIDTCNSYKKYLKTGEAGWQTYQAKKAAHRQWEQYQN